MTDTFDLANWVHKLHVEVINEEDGSATIQIEWDQGDSDLDYWDSLGEEGQQKFITDALYASLKNFEPTNNDT